MITEKTRSRVAELVKGAAVAYVALHSGFPREENEPVCPDYARVPIPRAIVDDGGWVRRRYFFAVPVGSEATWRYVGMWTEPDGGALLNVDMLCPPHEHEGIGSGVVALGRAANP